MGTENRIDACYMAQAQNLFKQLGLDPKGVKAKKEAMPLFNSIPFGASKDNYIKSIDTNKDGFISSKEYAAMLKRANDESHSANSPQDKFDKNDGITDERELLSDFVQHGAIPYLLSEAKKNSPQNYKKVEENLRNGTFTLSGDSEYNIKNIFKTKVNGSDHVSAIIYTLVPYQALTELFPKYKGHFFDKLAQGVVQKQQMTSGEQVTFTQNLPDKDFFSTGQILEQKEVFAENNPQKPISISRPSPILKFGYTLPKEPDHIDSDPLETVMAQKICQKVLTAQNLETYEKTILQSVRNPKKFTRFTQTLGEEIQKALETNVSQEISDKHFINKGAFYSDKTKTITFSQSGFEDFYRSLQSVGVPKNKIKQKLLLEIIKQIAHEYGHAAQYDFIKNPPKNATPEQLALIEKYEKNNKEYLDTTDSIILYGSIERYASQPMEASPHKLEIDIEEHFNKWNKSRKNKPLLTKTKSARHTKQGV